ncbi:MAG: hypothetical protein KKB31_05200, partial [Nanoarchaeota archaeon]|nr:hypothetical protein [Nanoarchaeota archaeon]
MIDQVIIVIYLLVMLSVGIYFSRKQGNKENFFLANRDLKGFHTSASILSTVAGAGMVFGIAAMGFTYGFSAFWFLGAGLAGFLLFSLAVPKIKKIADEHNCITLPELLKTKLDNKCMIISSIITMAIFGGIIAVNFLAAGRIIQIVFNLPLAPVVIGFGVIVTLYSLLGGFRAVVWTDIIQAFIIFVGLILIFVITLNFAEGFGALENLPSTYKDPLGIGWVLIIGGFLSVVLA